MRSFAGVAKRVEKGQNREVRYRVLPLLTLVLCAGCAQEEQLRPAAAPTSPSPWSANTEAPPPPTDPDPAAVAPRPRLSRTITLGQDDYSPAPNRPAPGQQSGSTTIVNNNVIVQQPPVMYGGYGGYGYGYGGYGGRTIVGDGRTGVGTGTSRGPWAPSGWEGAQRTAAPGQTPGVGGNWAPVQDSGPRPMR